MLDKEGVWQDYGLHELEKGIHALFPEKQFSVSELLELLTEGDILGAVKELFSDGTKDLLSQFSGLKSIFVWLLLLGVAAAFMTHFIDCFEKRQIADISFYFTYLLMVVVLVKSFTQVMHTAVQAIEQIVMFSRMLYPLYLIAVGVASGGTTVTVSYQILILLIYGVESILLGVVVPLIRCYCILAIVNGIWAEEKLVLLLELLGKGLQFILKAALWLVTGLGLFQAAVAPMVDAVGKSVLRKTISVIPGIGDAAEGVMNLVLGSAVVIKNSVGVCLLLLLLMLCAVPLLQLFLTALMMKAAAAFMGLVSDKRITSCAGYVGEAVFILFRTVGVSMLLFFISIALLAVTGGRYV